MEDKINKLFALFNDFKNQQLFSLALAQIVNVYNDYPACLYQILRKTNKLIYSRAQDPRLRLEHSQIAAAIIERTYKIYNERLEEYLLSSSNDSIPENLFHFEPILDQQVDDTMQQEQIRDYEEIKSNIKLKSEQIDFIHLINDGSAILGKDMKYLKRSQENKNQKLDDETLDIKQEEIMRLMGLSGNFNLSNITRLLEFMQGDAEIPIDMHSSSEEIVESSSDDDAVGQYRKRNKTKAKQPETNLKKKPQAQKKNQNTKYCVINPFNVIYNRAVYELMNHKWQERHASALVLKSIVRQKGFLNLGFSYLIKGDEKEINGILRANLIEYISDKNGQLNKLEYLLTRCCVLIVMDRFADYFGNQTIMIVREAACQTAITLLTDRNYNTNIWIHYPDSFMKFVLLLKDFIEEGQRVQIYEVSQSALFLVKGLLKDHLQVIFDNFSEMLLQVGQRDNEDEILELLADIWKEFLLLGLNQKYFTTVYSITMEQLKKQDDISFAGKSIFQFLSALFQAGFKIQKQFQGEVEILKMFFFHRIVEVKESFYSYLLAFSKQQTQKQNDSRTINFMKIIFQTGVFEEKLETFQNLMSILEQLSKHLEEEQLYEFIQFVHNFSTDHQFKKYFYLFDGMKRESIDIHYPNLAQYTQNPIDNQTYRMIKTAYLIKDINYNHQITFDLDPINFIYTFKNYINNKKDLNQEVDVSSQNGCCFDELDLKIQVSMQQLNILLKNYMQIEKEQEYLAIIQGFVKIYGDFAIAPAHSPKLRQLYPVILNQLKQLSQIDYEMDQESIQKLQDTTSDLVQSLQSFTKLSNELSLNFKVLTSDHTESLIQRIRIDKFHLIQDIASERLSRQMQLNPNCCDLTSLYVKQSTQQAVQYILSQKNELKRKDYGRKRLIWHLLRNQTDFQFWHLFFERLFLQQLNYIPNDLRFNSTLITQKTKLTIRVEDLKYNLWGIGLIQNAYSLFMQHPEHPDFDRWAQYLLSKLLNYLPVLSNISDDDNNKIILDDLKGGIQIEFDQTFKKLAVLKNTLLKLCAKFIHFLSVSRNISVFDQVIMQINQMLKRNENGMYEILNIILKEYPISLAPISGFLTLKAIKKLTAKDPNTAQAAGKLFGFLVPILTIMEAPYSPTSPQLINKFQKAKEFQLGFGKMTKVDYKVEGGIKDRSILRDYQWDGIRWLGFLIKYNLHAALCDDMGLGKTIQTLVVLANEVFKRKNENLVSLVVAPSTVVDHWYAETKKYISNAVLKPHIYDGVFSGNFIMVSYNQLLKLNQNFLNQEFYFLILDEAHILKNSKNKTSKVIRSLKAKHKIVLSGTPVQNHLLELWSLFDILLPNYLGDEEYFKKNFSKAFHTNIFSLTEDEILFDEQQIKTLRLLHKKVLPFIMRRTKQDVLPQLPAKIIGDYYCTLSEPLQSQIYQILESNSFSTDIEQQITKTQGEQKNKVCESVLKLLHKLRQALDHPILVRSVILPNKRPKKKVKTESIEMLAEQEINQLLDKQEKPDSYSHSGKMIALKDILQQLGFQSTDDAPQQQTQGDQITIYTNFNKVLVFSRFRAALQLIAEQLLKTQFPGLQYLILDGSVPQTQRYPLVTKFNEDPDIRVLLLTTQVGGLGLNLSSANIVIMFDHDYNPVNDQQAMDRAHRIGQKNVVQVFRLIVKDTLEEKIMGIQRFKSAISKAIVNQDNASLKQMEKTDLLSMLESTAQSNNKEKNTEEEQIEKLSGPYSKILGQLKLDLLEQLNFDKEY
ncbi:unnamed protein product (macronuclear) [Paramecium tetraurelia]|uniref:Uncharacterized protein n=1 Tax=Paramecium tetraurelia TaxID=5888 RepID=A0CIA5_PARTE|nr:uncharacterized protein GSPATT00007657001 [Paramecium tetraurelia]CAK70522.1 unnamed protein product [Paramecium tetraurelia]|eukprot:XP_001437919.1 hypothetical protein (macronuclear) [Paramecium tetraurelia strain d4-2]